MTEPTLWNQLLVWPIMNILLVFYKIFESIGIPGPLGFAIIGATVAIRLLLYPLMAKQLQSAQKMQELKPKLDELSKKHKDDKQKLQQAQLALYQEHGINPAAGCLPMLIQFPMLIALYRVFLLLLNNTADMTEIAQQINQIAYSTALHIQTLNTSFFGLSLSIKPSEWKTYGVWLLLIPLVTAGLQWYQSKLMTSTSQGKSEKGKVKRENKKIEKKSGKKDDDPVDTAQEMQKQMAIMMPIMFGFFAYQLPYGLALYWNTFGLFGIVQQLMIKRSK